MATQGDDYLRPYLQAVRKHGAGFKSLLWATPQTQAARFDALIRVQEFAGRNLLDAGCGRADLLDYLLARRIRPAHYVGIEAVPDLARVARAKALPDALIVDADFVRDPARLLVGADVIIFCGSLNTLSRAEFDATLRAAWSAATDSVAFNFLSSPERASASWLTWHAPSEVLRLARDLGACPVLIDDYLDGDCTVAFRKE